MKKHVILLALLFYSTFLHSAELGRFFTTVEQRYDMDRIKRHQNFSPEESINHDLKGLQEEVLAEEQKRIRHIPNQITMKGYVSRKDGSQTVWVNDGSSSFKSRSLSVKKSNSTRIFKSNNVNESLRIHKKGSRSSNVRISVFGQGKIRLKPGQTYNTQTKKTKDTYLVKKKHAIKTSKTPNTTSPLADKTLLDDSQKRIKQLQSLSNLGQSILK
jgi:hypothetical protein